MLLFASPPKEPLLERNPHDPGSAEWYAWESALNRLILRNAMWVQTRVVKVMALGILAALGIAGVDVPELVDVVLHGSGE